MKILGRGWQYTVYDIGKGRVLKKYNTWFAAYVVMVKDSWRYRRLPVINFSYYYREGKKSAGFSLQRLMTSSLDPCLIGNPSVKNAYEYEQDYVEPLFSYFKRVGNEERRRVIDRFIEFVRLLQNESFFEKNCNIADNFGLNNNGEIILIDLGEICFTKEEIDMQLQRRVWAAPDVVGRLPFSLRTYFVEEMDRHFGTLHDK